MTTWRIKRIYEEPADADGYRVLVDRLWPRGISKEAAHLDEWCKDVAPSTEARRDFGHDPARFGEFKARYRAELAASGAAGALAERLAGVLVGGVDTWRGDEPHLLQGRVPGGRRRLPGRAADAAHASITSTRESST